MPGITDPTEAHFKDGQWGWDGSRWRKLNLLWGYNDRYVECEESTGVAAGNQVLTFSTVPSGEIWVVETFAASASTTNPAHVQFRVHDGTAHRVLRDILYLTAWITVELPSRVILKAGDYLTARFTSCILNDDIYAVANGYKMKVAE